MIPLNQRWRIATGNDTDFSERVMVQLHRHATFRLSAGATGNEAQAARSVWANVSNFRFPTTLAVLNDTFVGVEDVTALAAIPDDAETGTSIASTVQTIWPTFVQVFAPEVPA